MTQRINLSVPDYQYRFLEEHNISPSSLFQDALDERIEELGWDHE